jgi:hypothetical protein
MELQAMSLLVGSTKRTAYTGVNFSVVERLLLGALKLQVKMDLPLMSLYTQD